MNEVEETIRELAPSRADGVAVPSRAPDGWTHLSVAMAKLAAALLNGPSRDWREAYPLIVEACRLATLDSDGERENGGGEQLVTFFTDIFSREAVLTGYRPVGGGSPVRKIPGDWWDVDDIYLRFRTWSIDPNDVLNSDISLPCWIWVDSAGLEIALRKVAAAKLGLVATHAYDPHEWLPLGEALRLLSEAIPRIEDPMTYLVQLLAPSAVEARATDAQKWFRGVMVLRENWCAVPSELWEESAPDPRDDLANGLVHISVGDAVHVLSGVFVGRSALLAYLKRSGFTVLPQEANVSRVDAAPTTGLDITPLPESEQAEIKVRVAKGRAVRECADWLEETYQTEAEGLPSKVSARETALEKWNPDLTGRAFNGAWASVAQDRPWMSKAGRRSGV